MPLIYSVKDFHGESNKNSYKIQSEMLLKTLIHYVKRRRYKIVPVVFIICLFFNSKWCPDVYYLTLNRYDDTSCYTKIHGDGLSSVEDSITVPRRPMIHFHETSCKGQLNSRQACAVESAARTHPNWQINVFFVGPVAKENLHVGSLKVLKEYDNVKLIRLRLNEYAEGTPLESFMNSGALNRTRWRICHTSDALRYLTLYKWGGVYLDLDVIVARSFEDLVPNWTSREGKGSISAGAISFSNDKLGRKMAYKAIRNFRDNYRGDMWGQNGPGVITRVLRNICSTSIITEMSANLCNGFEVYGPELFYPVHWRRARMYFGSDLYVGQPHIHHVWNKITGTYAVNRKSPYAQLAHIYCPKIYEAYDDNFGI